MSQRTEDRRGAKGAESTAIRREAQERFAWGIHLGIRASDITQGDLARRLNEAGAWRGQCLQQYLGFRALSRRMRMTDAERDRVLAALPDSGRAAAEAFWISGAPIPQSAFVPRHRRPRAHAEAA